MVLQELKEKRGDELKKADGILKAAGDEKRSLNEQELADVENCRKAAEAYRKEIDIIEEYEVEKRDQAITERGTRVPGEDGGFRSLGEFVYSAVFNTNDPRLVRDILPEEYRADPPMTVSNPSSLGYLVPVVYMEKVMTVTPQDAIVRPRATVIPADPAFPDASIRMPALDYSANMYGGAIVNWIDEAVEKPQTAISVNQISLTPYEVAAYMAASDKLLRNSGAAEILLTVNLRGALLASEDKKCFTGLGVGTPTGLIGHPGTVVVPRGITGHIDYADVVNMYVRLEAENNAVWTFSPMALVDLMTMQNPLGQYIWQPNPQISPWGTLLGIPLVRNQRQPGLGVEGDLCLCDFSDYLIKDGFGITVAKSEHVYFLNNETAIKAFRLVDGSPWLATPLTLEDGTTASPFVVLGDAASA